MLQAAIPALRRASSKLERRSRCFPTPLVRKIFFATNAMDGAGLRCLRPGEPEKFSRTKSSKRAGRCQPLFTPRTLQVDDIAAATLPGRTQDFLLMRL